MSVKSVTPELLAQMPLPQPEEGSKEDRGVVAVVGGCTEVPGAILLAGVAALRSGAGKLQLATVRSASIQLALAVPEALVMAAPESADGQIDRLEPPMLQRLSEARAVLIGPGMMGDGCQAIVADFLALDDRPAIVLDADAIPPLSKLSELSKGQEGRLIITPHAGEMAKLLDCEREEIEQNPLAAAREAANRFGVVVAMKGASTTIVDPSGGEWRYEGGCVGLGTSGSGDVLAGVIAGLLARGCDPSQAVVWGVYLHGEAGARLGLDGCLGFLARQIAGEIPSIMDRLR